MSTAISVFSLLGRFLFFVLVGPHVVLHRVSIRTLCESSWLCAGWGSVGEVDAASFEPADNPDMIGMAKGDNEWTFLSTVADDSDNEWTMLAEDAKRVAFAQNVASRRGLCEWKSCLGSQLQPEGG
jgi:hypothetical protein